MDKKIDKFVKDYTGKKASVPWNRKLDGQCVSLLQRYINEVYGVPLAIRGHAMAWSYTIPNAGLGKVVKVPQKGDIIVWGKQLGGGYGHVAIYLNASKQFDSNNGNQPGPVMTGQERNRLGYGPVTYIRMNSPSKPAKPVKKEPVKKKKTSKQVANDIWNGRYGWKKFKGDDREKRLKELNYNAKEVQDEINKLAYPKKASKPKKLKVGDKIKIKQNAKRYATGQTIPKSIKNRTHTIAQIRPNEYLLKEIYSWVFRKDVEK